MKETRVRRLLAALFGAAVMMVTSIPVLALDLSQIAVGGIGPGSMQYYVESVYGTPTAAAEFTADTGVHYKEYNYENILLVGFNEETNQAMYITCTGDNLSTPAGVAVGMTADVLSKVYGPADRIYSHGDKSLYVYDDGQGNQLSFDVQNFYIISINVRSRG